MAGRVIMGAVLMLIVFVSVEGACKTSDIKETLQTVFDGINDGNDTLAMSVYKNESILIFPTNTTESWITGREGIRKIIVALIKRGARRSDLVVNDCEGNDVSLYGTGTAKADDKEIGFVVAVKKDEEDDIFKIAFAASSPK